MKSYDLPKPYQNCSFGGSKTFLSMFYPLVIGYSERFVLPAYQKHCSMSRAGEWSFRAERPTTNAINISQANPSSRDTASIFHIAQHPPSDGRDRVENWRNNYRISRKPPSHTIHSGRAYQCYHASRTFYDARYQDIYRLPRITARAMDRATVVLIRMRDASRHPSRYCRIAAACRDVESFPDGRATEQCPNSLCRNDIP